MPCCNAELIEQVNQVIKDYFPSQAAAAKSADFEPSTFNTIVKGKYNIDSIYKVENKLRVWLDKIQKRQTSYKPLNIGFVPTSISKYIFDVIDGCRACKEMGVCVGKAGIGKTTSIIEYARQKSDVVVISAYECMSKHGLFAELAEALGLNPVGSTDVLFRRCKKRLHNGDFCIIVDEADQLNVDLIGNLRRVADSEVGGCGLALIGLPQLLINLRSYRKNAEHISSRFFRKEIKKELTDEGIKDICAAAGPVFSSWHMQFAKHTHNARHLVKALNMCQRIICTTEQKTGKPCPMGEDVIATAFEQLVF